MRLYAGLSTEFVRDTTHNRIADKRVLRMLALAQGLLDDNAEHVAACCRIDEQ